MAYFLEGAAALPKLVISLALVALTTAAAGQVNKVPRISQIISGTLEGSRALVEAMRAGLADEGLVDGRNVTLDAARDARFRACAASDSCTTRGTRARTRNWPKCARPRPGSA